MKKKPDALVILALIFGLGVLVSTLTHGDGDERYEHVSASAAGVQTLHINR